MNCQSFVSRDEERLLDDQELIWGSSSDGDMCSGMCDECLNSDHIARRRDSGAGFMKSIKA